MKFEELKKSLNSKILYLYILTGADEYLISHSKKLIINACDLEYPEMNLQFFDLSNNNIDEVIKQLMCVPFFSKRKVAVLENVNLDAEKKLEQYFKTPCESTIVIIIDKDNKLKMSAERVDCSNCSPKIIEQFVVINLQKQGKQISNMAKNKLLNYTLFDMTKINNELEKLISYIGDRTIIEENDVDELVPVSAEYQVFELTEALSKKDSNKAFDIINSFKDKKESKTLLYLIYNHLRRMFYTKISKKNVKEYCELLGIKEYAVKKAIEQGKFFSAKNLKSMISLCEKLDYDLKLSNISVENATELLALTILNK